MSDWGEIISSDGSRWRFVHIGFDSDDLKIGGVEVWKSNWRDTQKWVWLPHPSYPAQKHRYDLYEIGDLTAPIRFVASELSNGVWGFYVPQSS